eukprot:325657-Amphidinium_carterae.1
MTFHVSADTRIGIAGPSGGGKSTTLFMLQRYADPTTGDILVGEQALPLRLLNIRWWRKQLAVVEQTPILFNGSVRHNVLYGLDGEVSEERMEWCKQKACLAFLDKNGPVGRAQSSDQLDEARKLGWDTPVGLKGEGLSGGQKQRVAICRAFLRDAQVMLFDEATSALDVHTEGQILESVREMSANRTVFTIAHRLTTIVGCDTIFIVYKGGVAEKGPHKVLMEQNG